MGLCFCFRRPSSQCGRGSTPASRQVQVHLFLGVARLVATNMWFRVCAKLLIRAGTDPEASDGGSGGVCVSASAQCRTMQPEADVQRKHPKEQAGSSPYARRRHRHHHRRHFRRHFRHRRHHHHNRRHRHDHQHRV